MLPFSFIPSGRKVRPSVQKINQCLRAAVRGPKYSASDLLNYFPTEKSATHGRLHPCNTPGGGWGWSRFGGANRLGQQSATIVNLLSVINHSNQSKDRMLEEGTISEEKDLFEEKDLSCTCFSYPLVCTSSTSSTSSSRFHSFSFIFIH